MVYFILLPTLLFLLIIIYKILEVNEHKIRNKALRLYKKKKYFQSIAYLEKMHTHLQDNFYYSLLIEIYIESKNINEALILCSTALKNCISPDETLYNNISWAYYEAGDIKNTILYANEALKINSQFAPPYANIANCNFLNGDIDKAIEYYNKALTLDKHLSAALYGLGLCLYTTNRYDEAFIYLSRYVKKATESVNAYKMLADIYYKNEKIPEAISMYRIIIKINPLITWAYYELGNLLFFEGQLFDSIRILDKAIKLDETCAIAYYYKSRIYSVLRNIEEAFDCLEKAVKNESYLKLIAYDDDFLNNLKLYSRFKDIVGNRREDIIASLL